MSEEKTPEQGSGLRFTNTDAVTRAAKIAKRVYFRYQVNPETEIELVAPKMDFIKQIKNLPKDTIFNATLDEKAGLCLGTVAAA